MLAGYQTYIPVDSWGLLFKKDSVGTYQGYLVFTRNNKAVYMPVDDGMYLGLHKALEHASKGFTQMEGNGQVHITGGYEE